MVMYRVVKTGGKQFLVHEGMELTVDLMKVKKSDQVKFDCLLKFDDEGKTFELGAPLLKDKVSAEVIDNVMGEKIRIAKFKAKSRERKVMGFRSKLTKLKIVKIS